MRLEYMTCGYEVDGIHMMGMHTKVHKKGTKLSINLDTYSNFKKG